MWKKILPIAALIAILIAALKRKAIMTSLGTVTKKPEELALADGVDVEIESLARVGQSEESSDQGRIAVMWAAKNQAAKRHTSITHLVTNAKHIVNGEQIIEPYHGLYSRDLAGKYCSTYQQPTLSTLELSRRVFAGESIDPTNGATRWDAPGLLDALFALGRGKSAEAVAANREAEGLRETWVPGVERTRFWA